MKLFLVVAACFDPDADATSIETHVYRARWANDSEGRDYVHHSMLEAIWHEDQIGSVRIMASKALQRFDDSMYAEQHAF